MAAMKEGKAAPLETREAFVRRTLRTVVVALLIDILAFTIILPLFPRLIAHYESVDGSNTSSLYYAAAKAVRAFRNYIGGTGSRLDIILFGGFIGSLFSFLQFVSSPVIGRLSDQYGRRTVLLASMVGNALSMLLWIFSDSFPIFVLSRIVGGLTEGNVQMSIAMISDITTSVERSRALAWVGISFALGFTVGPPLGAYLTTYNLRDVFPMLPVNRYSSPALFALLLILVETWYMFMWLPETTRLPAHLRAKNDERRGNDNGVAKRGFGRAAKSDDDTTSETGPLIDHDRAFELRHDGEQATGMRTRSRARVAKASASPASATLPPKTPLTKPPTTVASTESNEKLWTLSIVHFLFLFSFSGMEFTLTFLTHDRFGFTHGQQGRLLAFMGIFSALVQGGYVRRVAHRHVSESTLVLQGVVSCCIGLGVIGVMALGGDNRHGIMWLYVGAAFLAVTSGTVVNSLTSLASMVYRGGDSSKNDDADERDGGGRGHALGKFRAYGQLGRSIGPIIACSCYWIFGSMNAYLVASGVMFVLAGGIRVFLPPPPLPSSASAAPSSR